MRRYILLSITLFAFILGIFFLFRGSPSTKPQSAITGHAVSYNNKAYLDKKVSESNFYRSTGATDISFTISNVVQPSVVAQRRNDTGSVETSLAYDYKKSGSTALITLYVNPSMYPPTDPVELEHQYSQLALIAIYKISHPNQQSDIQPMQLFVRDYRQHRKDNAIFNIK